MFAQCLFLRTQLASPYSSALKTHAYSIAPALRIPEPLDVWITCLSAMVPFKERVICVTADGMAHSHGVVQRAAIHFGNVAHIVAPSVSTLREKLAVVPEGSADGVIFCDNSFANFIAEAPKAITAAHRVIRKHGVVSVWGHQEVDMAGPTAACAAFKQYRDLLDSVCPIDSLQRGKQDPRLPLSQTALRLHSIAVAHDDIYFPFPSVGKRIFQSDLTLSLDEMVGVLKAWPQYRELMTPVPITNEAGVGEGMRLKCRGDPLQDLAGLCFNATRGETVTMCVKHFVINCDARPINQGRGQAMLLGGRKQPRQLAPATKRTN